MSDDSPGSEPKKSWFEPVVAILMGVTTLCTAWCSYESSRWTAKAGQLSVRAQELDRRAATLNLEAQQAQTWQAGLVMQIVEARIRGDEKLAEFYSARLDGELKPAWEKWIALRPFENSTAPSHPFDRQFYKPRHEDEIRAARSEAGQIARQAPAHSANAGGYLWLTVLLAIVLFFAGTAGRFDQSRVRRSSLAFAIALWAYVAVRIVMLPVM